MDEIDKSDPEFEAFLLELLSDFQVTIPELGTIAAKSRPFVVLTSNNYRDMSDALKRRCIHLYIDYPTIETEKEILRMLVEGYSNKEIAEELVVSPSTVHSHRSNLMIKLGMGNRRELIQYARQHGIIRD